VQIVANLTEKIGFTDGSHLTTDQKVSSSNPDGSTIQREGLTKYNEELPFSQGQISDRIFWRLLQQEFPAITRTAENF